MKIVKKISFSIMCLLLVIPMFLSNSSKLIAEESNTVTNSMMLDENLKNKATPFVVLDNGNFKYLDNDVLTIDEKNTVLDTINETNKLLSSVNTQETKYYKENYQNNTIVIANRNPMLQGYGYNGMKVFYWGVVVYLDKDTARHICVTGSGAASILVALIPGIGWTIAAAVGGFVVSSVCYLGINNGVAIQKENIGKWSFWWL